MKTITFFLICSFFLMVYCSCQDSHKQQEFDDIVSILVTPDSLLSTEDVDLKYNLGDVIFQSSKVVNNRIVLSISKKDLTKFNISEQFYEQMKEDMDNFNNSVDSSNMDMNKIFEESKLRFYEMKGKIK